MVCPVAKTLLYNRGILIIHLHVQPNGKRDCWAGHHGTAIKVKISAPAVDGAANEKLRRFLATQFGVATSKVKLIRGRQSRQKQVEVHDPKEFPEQLQPLLYDAERLELQSLIKQNNGNG